jgi:hypothetical protein
MGLMDFLRKKSSADMGLESSPIDSDIMSGNNLMNDPLSSNSYNPNSGTEFGSEHNNLSSSMNMSTMGNQAFGQSGHQSFTSAPDIQKDMQMISLKLDAIKSELDAMNQRLRNLESIAEREQMKAGKKWY